MLISIVHGTEEHFISFLVERNKGAIMAGLTCTQPSELPLDLIFYIHQPFSSAPSAFFFLPLVYDVLAAQEYSLVH